MTMQYLHHLNKDLSTTLTTYFYDHGRKRCDSRDAYFLLTIKKKQVN